MTIDDFGWIVLILAAALTLSLLVRIASRAYERRRAAELAEERWIGATLALHAIGIGREAEEQVALQVAVRARLLRTSEMPAWLITRALDKGWSGIRHAPLIVQWRPPTAASIALVRRIARETPAPSAELTTDVAGSAVRAAHARQPVRGIAASPATADESRAYSETARITTTDRGAPASAEPERNGHRPSPLTRSSGPRDDPARPSGGVR